MHLNTLDVTKDASAVYVVNSGSTLNRINAGTTTGPTFDLGADQPWEGRLLIPVIADDVGANAACTISIEGSTAANFANSRTLATLFVGNPAQVVAFTGLTETTKRGTNDYVVYLNNQHQCGNTAPGEIGGFQVVCRYIRVVLYVSALSSGSYAVGDISLHSL